MNLIRERKTAIEEAELMERIYGRLDWNSWEEDRLKPIVRWYAASSYRLFWKLSSY